MVERTRHQRSQTRWRPFLLSGINNGPLSGFDQAFDDWCDQAGLPGHSTAHGVRKAAAALMYENGASEAELCAIFGWKIGSRMAAYYAKKYKARRAQTRALGRLPSLGGEKAKRSDGAV